MTPAQDTARVRTVIGVDAGSPSLSDADHLIRRLTDALGLPDETVGCTHLIRTAAGAGTVVSLALAAAPDAEAAWSALREDPGLASAGLALGERRSGPADAAERAAVAAEEHASRTAGRAVVFPGVGSVTGTVTAADLLRRCAVDEIVVLGAPSGDPGVRSGAAVVTRDHVRPEWRAGKLVLVLTPAPGGMFAPFEVPDPTPCCADHS
jgi:hypothetical protein